MKHRHERRPAMPVLAANGAAEPSRPAPGAPATRAVLFDADGNDQDVELGAVDLATLSERQLLWIDPQGEPSPERLHPLGLTSAARVASSPPSR